MLTYRRIVVPTAAQERIALVEKGITVVASQRKGTDESLIALAAERGLLVRVDRGTPWGNPFVMRGESARDAVCDKYIEHLNARPDLLAQIGTLKGKVLACWCHPKRCHADHLAGLANGMEVAE